MRVKNHQFLHTICEIVFYSNDRFRSLEIEAFQKSSQLRLIRHQHGFVYFAIGNI